jgi:glycosyltransferase involved in cell wall biosynthesis
MMGGCRLRSVSIFFFAGDFTDVLRRYEAGHQQNYQTHNEVARLIHDLLVANHRVNIYSFVTSERREEQPIDGLRIISLGAKDYSAASLLAIAVEKDDANTIVAHFANLELLRAVAATKSRAIAVLANSYNNTGFRSALGKRKVVSLLNNPRFELVSNHCLPSTEHLAQIGVKREKLIAWDVPHPFEPAASKPKRFVAHRPFEVVYVGSITEGKGITDLIRAVAMLRKQGIEVHCSLAGLGDIESMRALGTKLNIAELLTFFGLIGNNEVFNMMAAADLVIVPSRTAYPEGFPLTMFEAIASRTPIVCSDHPMLRPVMLDGRNASVFPAGDYRALAAAILRTLTNPALYEALSNNALSTWQALKGPADWRTMIVKWVVEGRSSPWLHDHMLTAVEQRR